MNFEEKTKNQGTSKPEASHSEKFGKRRHGLGLL
jgi:hypothetical protein